MSLTLLGTIPCLTLYIKIAISCKHLFCRLGRLARLRKLEYSTDSLYVMHNPKGPFLYSFNFSRASEALQCHVR